MTRRRERGVALPDVLVALALVGLVLGGAWGALTPWARGRALEEGARALAAELRLAGQRALVGGRAVALEFPEGAQGVRLLVDGDGDGLSRADLERGIDRRGPLRGIARDYPGLVIGLPPWGPIEGPPPGRALLEPGDDPVRFGAARRATFTPTGHASPGSLYLRAGEERACAIVVAGAGARVRLWCRTRGSAWERRR